MPPISMPINASASRPNRCSRRRTARSTSSPQAAFSASTVGTPSMAIVNTLASSSSASASITLGTPYASTAFMASSRPM